MKYTFCVLWYLLRFNYQYIVLIGLLFFSYVSGKSDCRARSANERIDRNYRYSDQRLIVAVTIINYSMWYRRGVLGCDFPMDAAILTRTYITVHMHSYTCTRMFYLYMHTYIHTHVYMYICLHMCVLLHNLQMQQIPQVFGFQRTTLVLRARKYTDQGSLSSIALNV